MHHRHVDPETIEDHFERLISDPEPDQETVDHPLVLQQHHPGRRAHQQRGPKGYQNKNEQYPLIGRLRGGDQIGNRVTDDDAQKYHDGTDPEGFRQIGQIDSSVFLGLDEALVPRHFQIDRSKQIARRIAGAGVLDRPPIGDVAPALVEGDEVFLDRRSRQAFDPPGRLHGHRAKTGDFVIQPQCRAGDGLGFIGVLGVRGEGFKGRFTG